MNRIIESKNAPQAIGPYSQAVNYNGLIYTSGQLPLSPESGLIESTDICEQTKQSIKNVRAILESAGSGLDKVIKTTIFITNMSDFPKVNEVYASFFENDPPARSCVEVSKLPKDALVEIEAIALTCEK